MASHFIDGKPVGWLQANASPFWLPITAQEWREEISTYTTLVLSILETEYLVPLRDSNAGLSSTSAFHVCAGIHTMQAGQEGERPLPVRAWSSRRNRH